jgi:hypothetical protein
VVRERKRERERVRESERADMVWQGELVREEGNIRK